LDSPPSKCFNSQGAVKQYLAHNSITEIEYPFHSIPFHSPNLALNDFWLFPKIKYVLKE